MLDALKVRVKQALVPLLYRYPPIGLQPTELGIYLDTLYRRAAVPGDVLEVGCSVGGTACIASRVVAKHSPAKRYICVDTFGGFVPEQFAADAAQGTPQDRGSLFTSNDEMLVRRILDKHGCQDVQLLKGDICAVPDAALPDRISVVLLDVDLEIPTYEGLKRLYPRLSPGGVILVDDCSREPAQKWRAYHGFRQFCEEMGLEPRLDAGLGVVEAAAG